MCSVEGLYMADVHQPTQAHIPDNTVDGLLGDWDPEESIIQLLQTLKSITVMMDEQDTMPQHTFHMDHLHSGPGIE